MFSAALLAAQSVSAPPETVAAFLIQAEAVISQSQDTTPDKVDAVRSAIQQAALAYRAALAEANARGEPPTSCPPPPGEAQLSLSDMIEDFRTFPQANRAMPLDAAFAFVMTLRYPCQASRP
ncbi:hypothetical protein [Blastomonas sp.]|uniref:hypothetical protein n=1 Tax=Blastomonas sp. TaxID=1909299 RepID=UPI003593739B